MLRARLRFAGHRGRRAVAQLRGPQWRWLPWVRRRARRAARQAILDAAAQQQRREYERACARRIAHALNNRWNGPTEIHGTLLTLGQLNQYKPGERR
ncbi:hypothetical protein SAMN05444365_11326 [Micromonospora pattaloongensis]|uniref:Uncharacterized protein n=1 Tax=Micromonospora pattaloongensis TaxID=405436 RepID=A0A1H3SQB0_9ACTN|nr:hypothetical protein [Micromonospora pattaloongensis]SDZ39868.1 hypothetical protein SAMN05444365_11326 [Micromonospora pattaloongensis]